MAPGRPILSVGIQPQIALYSAILGSVCAFSWYTEKYRRDEDDLDGQIRKLYLRDAQEAQSKMPQLTAAIKGQSMNLDGRMDKMVWGGKAKLTNKSTGGNRNSGNETESVLVADEETIGTKTSSSGTSEDEEKRKRKRPKNKRKKQTPKYEGNEEKRTKQKETEIEWEQRQKALVLQSSMIGVAIGAVTVATVSVMFGGTGGGKK